MSEIDDLREHQINVSIPHIGPLLDRWEHMSNDVKGSLRVEDEVFCALMDALEEAWMSEPPILLGACRKARSCQNVDCICEVDPTTLPDTPREEVS